MIRPVISIVQADQHMTGDPNCKKQQCPTCQMETTGTRARFLSSISYRGGDSAAGQVVAAAARPAQAEGLRGVPSPAQQQRHTVIQA